MELGLILLLVSLVLFTFLVKAIAELLEYIETKRSSKPHLREQL
jgi:uncharacterized membrane protein